MESVHFTSEQLNERFEFSTRYKNIVFGLIGLGIVLILVGWLFSGGGEAGEASHALNTASEQVHMVADTHGHGAHAKGVGERMVSNFLISAVYFLTLAMGALFFLTVHQVADAGWHTAIRRIPEAMTMYLPVALIGFGVLFFLMDGIYEWLILHQGEDLLVDEKRGFLNKPFFGVRTLIYFGGWIGAAYWLRSLSVRQDREGGLMHFNRSTGISAAFIFFFAFSYSLFAVDWIKSLEPHWFSTIFGVYIFGGSFQCAMLTIGLLLWFLRKQGYMHFTNDSHYHDIFKFAFGFSVFWGYIFIAQYLLIWYSNIPEEGIYYIKRYMVDEEGIYLGYRFMFFANIFLCFVIPFLGFMTRNSKRMPQYFVPLAAIVLVGHWTDMFVLIMPGAMGYNPGIGPIEVGFFLTFAGIFLYAVFNALSKASLAPVQHPYLEESLHHTTGPV